MRPNRPCSEPTSISKPRMWRWSSSDSPVGLPCATAMQLSQLPHVRSRARQSSSPKYSSTNWRRQRGQYAYSIIVRSFDTAAKRLNLPMKYETFGGNTVAKNLFFAGITSVVHYPGDDKLAHVPNEYVIIDELVLGSVLYAETLEAYFFG